jgi:hypothetical protein
MSTTAASGDVRERERQGVFVERPPVDDVPERVRQHEAIALDPVQASITARWAVLGEDVPVEGEELLPGAVLEPQRGRDLAVEPAGRRRLRGREPGLDHVLLFVGEHVTVGAVG